jgi:RHS repeat-associated protein
LEVTQQVFTAGNFINYTYDNIGQLKTAQGYESNGVTPRLHEQFGYAYDKAWNLNNRTNNALLQNFAVNDLNELSSASRVGTVTVAGSATEAGSGVSSVTVNGAAASVYSDGTFAKGGFIPVDGSNTYTAVAQDSNGRGDTNSVTAYLPANPSYLYDANGNLTNDGARNFVYDDENQLIAVWVANAWSNSFAYDGLLRRRIKREYNWQSAIGNWQLTNEVHFIYDGYLVLQERDGNNLPITTYTRGIDLSGSLQGAGGIGGLLARSDRMSVIPNVLAPGNTNLQYNSYYMSDAQGNVTALVSPSEMLLAQYEYDPYGNVIAMSGLMASANKYRFSTKEWNEAAGLYYYGFRFYDPGLQRWVNRDPLGDLGFVVYANGVLSLLSDDQDPPSEAPGSDDFLASQTRIQMNLHRVMGNNPVNYYDPAGLAEVYCKRQNGEEERLHNASVDDLAKKLDQAAKEKNPIDDLRIKGHGAPELMQMSKESLLTTANGKILDDKGNDLTDKFKNGLTPNAMVCLNGCETGRGKDNIAKDMSQILPGKVVAGGKGLYQLNVPFTSSAIGKKNYYINGKVCNSQW